MVKFDVERARRETRGCEKYIHFNNAGASLPPIPVTEALFDYLREEEEQGGYEVMARRAAELDHFYTAAAQLLNCSAEEVAFADSATRAWNSAFYAFNFQPGDRILASSAEYGSNLVALLHQAKRIGVEISWVLDDPSGQIDINNLEKQIDKRVKLICLTQVPSGGGLVNPAAEVGKVAKAAGVRRTLLEQLEPNQLNHHAAQLLSTQKYQLRMDAKRFECWERNYAAQLAFGVAIDYALAWGLENISERVRSIASKLRQELFNIDGVTLADQGDEQCAIVTFFSAQIPADQLQQQLACRQINTSVVPFSANPVSSEKLHQPSLLRASPHYYNTNEEVERFVATLKEFL
jgi:selenocysteine lyase/cysteine desulfurase